ncbi:MAG: Splicing factor [Chrysothrix sp. TS-e1954]|nr:MAG: Splicing factor [Chrysothrix sp. TS-e1954]
MDIKALLSPQEQPASRRTEQQSGSTPTKRRARAGSLKDYTLVQQAHLASAQRPGYSYGAADGSSQPSAGAAQQRTQQASNTNGTYQYQARRPPAPRSYSDPHSSIPQAHPTSSPRSGSRHGSTSMDTLADLASMQQYTAKPNMNGSRGPDLQSPQRSPTLSNLQFRMDGTFEDGNVSMTPTRSRHASVAADHPMSDAPTPTLPPTTFEVPSLSQDDSQTIAKLANQISESSFVYDTHVQLVTLLRKGFIAHVSPTEASDALQDPSRYNLILALRQARDAMLSRFPVGEQLWVDWLEDECMLAKTMEERAAVSELFEKSVQEEVGSTRLWRLYGHWMWYLYRTSFDITTTVVDSSVESASILGRLLSAQHWSEEDKLIGQELFSWDAMMSVWDKGVHATQWNIGHGHRVWDARMEILMIDMSTNDSPMKYERIKRLYTERTRQPHMTWDETFSGFSQLISKHESDSEYENAMAFATERAAKAKHEMSLRQEREFHLQQAIETGDHVATYRYLIEYLEWESQQERRKHSPYFSLDLHRTLLERANLLLPTDAALWEDHLDLVMEKKQFMHTILAVAHRATRHCPWSGELWSRYLYNLESHPRPYSEVENVKHHATSTGLLEELGGMDELIKVFTAWCGFLRRQAFGPNAREDDQDVAHVGIRSALEDVKEIGERKYGKDFKGDPLYRVERIYFKFLTQIGSNDEARKMYEALTVTHGNQYEFWDRYYLFEMTSWGKEFGRVASKPSDLLRPEHATRVLQRAMRRSDLDWPEKIIEAYIHHCGQHETVEKLQEALIEARRATKQVSRRRAREHAEQASAQQQQIHSQMQETTLSDHSKVDDADFMGSGKRKRDDLNSQPTAEASAKRPKSGGETTESSMAGDQSASKASQVKRDRENTLVTVNGLPLDCNDEKLRRFFKDCGEILSMSLTASKNGASNSAVVEFASAEDVLTARTKDKKKLDGATVQVKAGTRTTLWVTNYPAEADEEFIRTLFKSYGDIVEVRFPSLLVNTHRRFCYVQFLTAEQAEAATELDGMPTEHDLKLIAKISDPKIKQDRHGSTQEGRELFIGGLHWKATEDELEEAFKTYGTVERHRILRKTNGESRGVGFVVFATQDEAKAALVMDGRPLRGRSIKVSLANNDKSGGNKKFSATIINKAGSPATESAGSPMSGIEAGSPGDSSQRQQQDKPNYRERSIALMHVPDTVNDARVRAVVEPYGSLVKIILRPDHQGAIIEYESVADAGKASMGLQGYEIIPGRRIEVGSVPAMMQMGPEDKSTKKSSLAMVPPATLVRRPGQGNPRRGGRGGLGFKKESRPGEEKKGEAVDVDMEKKEAKEVKGVKTQDDFRAMLEKKQ